MYPWMIIDTQHSVNSLDNSHLLLLIICFQRVFSSVLIFRKQIRIRPLTPEFKILLKRHRKYNAHFATVARYWVGKQYENEQKSTRYFMRFEFCLRRFLLGYVVFSSVEKFLKTGGRLNTACWFFLTEFQKI